MAILQPVQFIFEELVYRALALEHAFRSRQLRANIPTILVNGSPKSGTTWMARMLESLPGTRSAGHTGWQDIDLSAIRPGDVLHGHLAYSPSLGAGLRGHGIRTVLMVRDPRDQTVSRMFHIRREESHPWHQRFNQMSDGEALMACIEGRDDIDLPDARAMIELTESWRAAKVAVCMVRFEDLLRNPAGHMQRVFQFLEIPVSGDFLSSIVQRNRFERLSAGRNFFRKARARGEPDPESHFRKGIKGDWRNHFRPRHVARFKQLAGQTLLDWGYESGPDW